MSSLDLILIRITKLEQCITELSEKIKTMTSNESSVMKPTFVERSTMTPPATRDSPTQTI